MLNLCFFCFWSIFFCYRLPALFSSFLTLPPDLIRPVHTRPSISFFLPSNCIACDTHTFVCKAIEFIDRWNLCLVDRAYPRNPRWRRRMHLIQFHFLCSNIHYLSLYLPACLITYPFQCLRDSTQVELFSYLYVVCVSVCLCVCIYSFSNCVLEKPFYFILLLFCKCVCVVVDCLLIFCYFVCGICKIIFRFLNFKLCCNGCVFFVVNLTHLFVFSSRKIFVMFENHLHWWNASDLPGL